jgi:hypothetical protein
MHGRPGSRALPRGGRGGALALRPRPARPPRPHADFSRRLGVSLRGGLPVRRAGAREQSIAGASCAAPAIISPRHSHAGRMRATMRWVERLWRDDGRVKATPARVAASLAEGVTQSTNVLRARLEEQGLSRADRKRFESEACILECLLFEWFLRDISVPLEFGRHTDTIQHALARRLAADLDRSGLSPSVLLDFERLRHERFPEYRTRSRPAPPCRRWGRWPGAALPTRTH